MTVSIVFRNDDTRWGSGTGAGVGGKVTSLQEDENHYNLKTAVETLQAAEPKAISSITYLANAIQVNYNDSTSDGPFPLPVAMINPVGEWLPLQHYNYLDLFSVGGQGMFLVLVEHTSAASFDANATDGTTDNNPLYQLWAPLRDVNYDVSFSITGSIEGATEPTLLAQIVVPRAMTMAENLSGGYAYLNTPTDTETLDLVIEQNGNQIGTITFEPGVGLDTGGGQFGTISFPADVNFVASDRIAIRGPTSTDLAAADLSITLPATRTDI